MAAYRASVSSAAVSQIRSSVECSSSPDPTDRMASSSRNRGTRAAGSSSSPPGPWTAGAAAPVLSPGAGEADAADMP
jgi:hypothetical protein